MIKIENVEVVGWKSAIRGMRNPMNSWEKSDSYNDCPMDYDNGGCMACDICEINFIIGPNDLKLMKKLAKAGTDHRKFMRFIDVYLDITAPLYWWKEFDTYRAGVAPGGPYPDPMEIEMDSCSTMHKIHSKEFELDDFSHEHLVDGGYADSDEHGRVYQPDISNSLELLNCTISTLNYYREKYIHARNDSIKKRYWWQMIQLLPSSYNQRRTVKLNYEVLANMYKARRNHKLDEWHTLCDWIETLPYSELITGKEDQVFETAAAPSLALGC